MAKQWIKNFAQIATSGKREAALSVVNAAFNAIDTPQVMSSSLSLEGDLLRIKDRKIKLAQFQNIYVIGFGKAANQAAMALEKILESRLAGGIVLGTSAAACACLQTFQGTHPLPSAENFRASGKIVQLAKRMTANDLVLVVVSGGGSALLCWPQSECEQGRRLYQDFLRTGGTIVELNTVRKHLSALKGGGLAAMLHPATVAGLIFSDVPGNNGQAVASGPTYRDETTIEDARRVLSKYHLSGYELVETQKEARYFEKVCNIPLVSNQVALQAMMARARALQLNAVIISDSLYDSVAGVAGKFLETARRANSAALFLAGGEPEAKIPARHGRGGRNQLLTLQAMKIISNDQVFISFGSDGRDNGDAAGAIADGETAAKTARLGLDIDAHLHGLDSQTFFERTGDLIITGPTGANVYDLMLLLDSARK